MGGRPLRVAAGPGPRPACPCRKLASGRRHGPPATNLGEYLVEGPPSALKSKQEKNGPLLAPRPTTIFGSVDFLVGRLGRWDN